MKSSSWLDETLSSITNVLFQRIYQLPFFSYSSHSALVKQLVNFQEGVCNFLENLSVSLPSSLFSIVSGTFFLACDPCNGNTPFLVLSIIILCIWHNFERLWKLIILGISIFSQHTSSYMTTKMQHPTRSTFFASTLLYTWYLGDSSSDTSAAEWETNIIYSLLTAVLLPIKLYQHTCKTMITSAIFKDTKLIVKCISLSNIFGTFYMFTDRQMYSFNWHLWYLLQRYQIYCYVGQYVVKSLKSLYSILVV